MTDKPDIFIYFDVAWPSAYWLEQDKSFGKGLQFISNTRFRKVSHRMIIIGLSAEGHFFSPSFLSFLGLGFSLSPNTDPNWDRECCRISPQCVSVKWVTPVLQQISLRPIYWAITHAVYHFPKSFPPSISLLPFLLCECNYLIFFFLLFKSAVQPRFSIQDFSRKCFPLTFLHFLLAP